MRILFILPKDGVYCRRGGFLRTISYAPLTLCALAALVPKGLNAEITLVDEGVQKPITDGIFDIVGVTCVASNAKRAYELCGYWSGRGSHTLLGGAHPTLMESEAMGKADTVFSGPAEKTLPKFFEDYACGDPQEIYRHIQTPNARLSMPIPRRDLNSRRYMGIPTVIANRGCTNQCMFCSIPKLCGGTGFARPISDVVGEIKQMRSRYGAKRFILLDPSMSSDREYAKELFAEFAKLKIQWSGLATIDIADDDELFEALARSGCAGILAGFESVDGKTLMHMGKKSNRADKYKSAVEKCHGADIPVLGCFVVGFDEDTQESIAHLADCIDEIRVDIPRFSILTPFPGTQVFDAYERQGRILTKDWDLYDTMHAVFQPNNMNANELESAFHDLWKRSYGLKRILGRTGYTRKNILAKLAVSLGFMHYARSLSIA